MDEKVPVSLRLIRNLGSYWLTQRDCTELQLASPSTLNAGSTRTNRACSLVAQRLPLRDIGVWRLLSYYCLSIWRQPQTLGNQRVAVQEYLAEIIEVVAIQ